MILDSTIRLEAVLAASASASNPECHVCFIEYNPGNELTRPSMSRKALTHITDATILEAPTINPIREVQNITIYNKDTQAATVTVKTDDGTERILVKQSLSAGSSLIYEKGSGWKVL